MSITIQESLPQDKWLHFVNNHPDGNIFHTPQMFQVFNRTRGHQPQIWAATKEERILALLLPVRVTLMQGLLRYFTTRSIGYGSVLCVPGAEGKEALTKLLQVYTKEVDREPLFTELRNLSDLETYQPILRKQGFIYEDHLNFLINLARPTKDIMQSIGRRTRKHIRRELRRGKVVVREVSQQSQLDVCYDLVRRTYRAAHVPLADPTLFEAAYEVLGPKGMIRFTLAYVEESPVAVSVDLLFKDVMYGWFGGLDRSSRSYMPNELLTWHLFEWGAENGFHTYDFGGAGKPDEDYGVRDFKAKFGGNLVCCGRNTHVHAPLLLWIGEKGYNVLRRWL